MVVLNKKKKQHKLHILVSYSKSEKKHILLWLVIPITNLSPQMESKYKRAFCKYVLHWPYSKINTLSSSCRWLRKIRPKIFISAKSKICTTNRLKKKEGKKKKKGGSRVHQTHLPWSLLFNNSVYKFNACTGARCWKKKKTKIKRHQMH